MIKDMDAILQKAFANEDRSEVNSDTKVVREQKSVDSVGMLAMIYDILERSAIMENDGKISREKADLESANLYLKRYKVTIEEI